MRYQAYCAGLYIHHHEQAEKLKIENGHSAWEKVIERLKERCGNDN